MTSDPMPRFAVEFSNAPVAPQPLDVPAVVSHQTDPTTELLQQQSAETRLAAGFAAPEDRPSLDPRSVPRPPRVARHGWRTSNGRAEKVEQLLLGMSDRGWLLPLAQRETEGMDSEWLSSANELARLGSIDIGLMSRVDPALKAEVIAARSRFWGELCGLDMPEHPLHKPYRKYMRDRTTSRPIDRQIATFRQIWQNYGTSPLLALQSDFRFFEVSAETLHNNRLFVEDHGYAPQAVMSELPEVTMISPPTREARYAVIADSGVDAHKVVSRNLRVLLVDQLTMSKELAKVAERGGDQALRSLEDHPNPISRFARRRVGEQKIERRKRVISEVSRILRFSKVDPEALLEYQTSIGSMALNNLMAKIKVIAKFADKDEAGNRPIPTTQLGTVLTMSPHNYMLWLDDRRQKEQAGEPLHAFRFKPENINAAAKDEHDGRLSEPAKIERIHSLLEDPEYRAYVGKPIIDAWLRWHNDRTEQSMTAEV